MNPDSNSSASNTDTTSTNGQKQRSSESKPGGPASEAEFLQRQAEEAAKAISQVFGEFSKNLKDGLDPTLWTKEHPWAMVAGATVAGFAAAAMFVPSKEEQALRKLVAMEKALMPKGSRRAAAYDGDGHDSGEDGGAKDFSKGRTGFLGAIGRQVLETIKPALMSALTAGITAKAATPDAEYQAPQPPPTDPSRAQAAPTDPSSAI